MPPCQVVLDQDPTAHPPSPPNASTHPARPRVASPPLPLSPRRKRQVGKRKTTPRQKQFPPPFPQIFLISLPPPALPSRPNPPGQTLEEPAGRHSPPEASGLGAQSAGAMSRRRRAGQVQAQTLIDLDSDAEDGERAPVPTAKSSPFLPRMMSGASRSDSPG